MIDETISIKNKHTDNLHTDNLQGKVQQLIQNWISYLYGWEIVQVISTVFGKWMLKDRQTPYTLTMT